MSNHTDTPIIQQIVEIVRECGEIILSATDVERNIHYKEGKGNFVTEYDSRVQAALEEKLRRVIPEAVFMGEEDEMDETDISRGYAFIVDPIDGTANFTRGYDYSSISVGVTKDGKPVMGVVYNPYRKEMFWAERGKGAFRNGEPIHVSDRTLDQAMMLFGTAAYNRELSERTFEVAYRYYCVAEDFRRGGSAALDLCNLACGRADFFFELKLCPWDYTAGTVIVEEAGGIVSDLQGNPITFDKRQEIAARAPRVELLKL